MSHPTHFRIRPALGADGRPLRLRDPHSGEYLPAQGALMPRLGFWLRRLADGDVVEISTQTSGEPAPAPAQAPAALPAALTSGDIGGTNLPAKKAPKRS